MKLNTLKIKKKYYILLIFVLLVVIVTGLAIIFITKLNQVNIPANFTSAFTLQNGYKVNYDPNLWSYKIDSTLGATLNSKKNAETIIISVSKIEKQTTEESLIAELIKPLQKDNITLERSKQNINGVEFNRVELTDKGDENIIKDDKSVSFLKLEGDIYTSITILNVQGDDALAVVGTLRK